MRSLSIASANNQAPSRRDTSRREDDCTNLRIQLKSLLVINSKDDEHDVNVLLDAAIEKAFDGTKSVDTIVREVSNVSLIIFIGIILCIAFIYLTNLLITRDS
jgi:hypothetical protein